jgi:hypothetical protein
MCVYVCVERERERCNFFFFKKWRLVCRERKREAIFFFIKKMET